MISLFKGGVWTGEITSSLTVGFVVFTEYVDLSVVSGLFFFFGGGGVFFGHILLSDISQT